MPLNEEIPDSIYRKTTNDLVERVLNDPTAVANIITEDYWTDSLKFSILERGPYFADNVASGYRADPRHHQPTYSPIELRHVLDRAVAAAPYAVLPIISATPFLRRIYFSKSGAEGSCPGQYNQRFGCVDNAEKYSCPSVPNLLKLVDDHPWLVQYVPLENTHAHRKAFGRFPGLAGFLDWSNFRNPHSSYSLTEMAFQRDNRCMVFAPKHIRTDRAMLEKCRSSYDPRPTKVSKPSDVNNVIVRWFHAESVVEKEKAMLWSNAIDCLPQTVRRFPWIEEGTVETTETSPTERANQEAMQKIYTETVLASDHAIKVLSSLEAEVEAWTPLKFQEAKARAVAEHAAVDEELKGMEKELVEKMLARNEVRESRNLVQASVDAKKCADAAWYAVKDAHDSLSSMNSIAKCRIDDWAVEGLARARQYVTVANQALRLASDRKDEAAEAVRVAEAEAKEGEVTSARDAYRAHIRRMEPVQALEREAKGIVYALTVAEKRAVERAAADTAAAEEKEMLDALRTCLQGEGEGGKEGPSRSEEAAVDEVQHRQKRQKRSPDEDAKLRQKNDGVYIVMTIRSPNHEDSKIIARSGEGRKFMDIKVGKSGIHQTRWAQLEDSHDIVIPFRWFRCSGPAQAHAAEQGFHAAWKGNEWHHTPATGTPRCGEKYRVPIGKEQTLIESLKKCVDEAEKKAEKKAEQQ